ncbi:MAG: IPT/TIG domain-containing protein [Desulfuromonadaceae bacterium]|nr:IPT/TIG domain-containing protein [Desulfuromonadaceae bacterium]
MLTKYDCGKLRRLLVVLKLSIVMALPNYALAAQPVLNFSDIESGPKTGNTDGVGGLTSAQHGAIVTVWGNNLGSTQGNSKIYIGGVEAAHVYYWKDADGTFPGGSSDLKTYHKMQEIAFSIPSGAPDGPAKITVKVDSIDSTSLPFTVRLGNIRYVKTGGNDSGIGTWSKPWASLEYVVSGAGGGLTAGDIIYSVGVGTTKPLTIAGPLTGTSLNPLSLISYPNSLVKLTGTGVNGYSVYNTGNNPSSYWNFSKIKVETTGSAFSPVLGARWVGLEITGPTVYAGYSGAIGGSNSLQAGGGKIYGLYIHHYGTDNGVATAGNLGTQPPATGTWDVFQHLFYLSARNPSLQIEGYEIAWGHFTDNPIYQGIHIYDMGTSIGWISPIKIHHNVIKNQRGNAINVDLPSLISTPIEIHDNLCISDVDDVYNSAALHVVVYNPSIPIKIYNNTFYGYNVQNSLSGGTIDYRNNIVFDTKGVAYLDGSPASQSSNLFYSSKSKLLAIPVWSNSELNLDPRFVDTMGNDFSLKPDSPIRSLGADSVLSVSPTDFWGKVRKAGSVSIGAFDYDTSPKKMNATIITP